MRPRLKRLARRLALVLVFTVVFILVLAGVLLLAIETPWGKGQIRNLLVRQANNYLTAKLSIGTLEGSLFRDLELTNVELAQDGAPVVSIERVRLNYSIEELLREGTVLRGITITRPHVNASRLADGRWNLAALVRRQARDRERTGPGRALDIQSIEIIDGLVVLHDPLTFGAARVPRRFERLTASFSFQYVPVDWRIEFAKLSWVGGPGDLTMDHLAGVLSNGAAGWTFDTLLVNTPKSLFTLDGRIERGGRPAVLDLAVAAERFDFQEWATVIAGLRNIAIVSEFTAGLKGPLARLATDIELRSNGGDVRGSVTLDTTVPGWRGAGKVTLTHLDLAPWFNRPDRPSDITGDVGFDLALQLGRGVPRGSYTFAGSRASYLGYHGERVRVRGDITATQWRIAGGTAVAYGGDIVMAPSTIGLSSPYPYHFQGTAAGVDLRRLPPEVPVPHVESRLAFEYDAEGQFADPFISGRAWFEDSEFIGARVAAGTVGSIDTAVEPMHYSGEGDLTDVDINRFGEALDVGWMRDPRYAGTLSGRFHVDGSGTEAASMMLNGGGHLSSANMFDGTLSEAEVSVTIADGSLTGSYDGQLASVDPAIVFADTRFAADLTGTGTVRFAVQDLLIRSPALTDYYIDGTIALADSEVQGLAVERGRLTGTLIDGTLDVAEATVTGPLLTGAGTGSIDFQAQRVEGFQYDIAHADLALAADRLGRPVAGQLAMKGSVSGPFSQLRLEGSAGLSRVEAVGIAALTTTGQYEVVVPSGNLADATVRVTAHSSFLEVFGEPVNEAAWEAAYDGDRLSFNVQLAAAEVPQGSLVGAIRPHPGGGALDLLELTVKVGESGWRLATPVPPPTLSWNDDGLAITRAGFVDEVTGEQRVELSGTWRYDGEGALRIVGSRVFLDTFAAAFGPESPPRYGGILDVDALLRGTRERPIVTGELTITEGRVYRMSFERLAGRVGFEGGMLQVDLQLDQAPGVWLTATGTVPPALFSTDAPERPVSLAVRSSRVSLSLIEGITSLVRDVTGELVANVDIVGTSHDPHFVGTVEISEARFVVAATGASYRNGNARFDLTQDRATVSTFSLQDRNGRPLQISGSLGTHELRVGDVEIDVRARDFEVLRNAAGTANIDASLSVRGQFEAPVISGAVSIVSGELRVDEILSRALFQPYATQAAPPPSIDAIAALNPWDRITLDNIAIYSQGALRLTGDSVLVSENTPLGLGSFDIHAPGEIYILKQPGQPVSITGSLDTLTGNYEFQGRRFDLYPSSSVDFRDDFRNPNLFITVNREISGVETRVTISGTLREPELRLSSNPPLDPSDVLSLIVFNTTTNELTAGQQQELAVRAGTLAVGFFANTLTTALERTIGIDILEIEPSTGVDRGAKVTVGQEIAPGLVARFSRHFGTDQYDEATIEYQISRILRIRATFSDAGSVATRSPFRRIERAGIDLLFFFSF